MRRGGKPPVLRVQNQPLAAGIVVKIIELRLPERLRLNLLRMPRQLPESPPPVRTGLRAEFCIETRRQMLLTVSTKLVSSIFTESEDRGIERFVE